MILNSAPGSRILANVTYNVGRSLSYSLVGFLLGLAGSAANAFLLGPYAAIVGGTVMIVMGLAHLFPVLGIESRLRLPASVTLFIGRSVARYGHLTGLLLGTASGLLPCGMLLPAYGLALATGHPITAAAVMFVFSLGTYPVMFSVGAGSRWLAGRGTLLPRARVLLAIALVALGIGIIFIRISGVHDHGAVHAH